MTGKIQDGGDPFRAMFYPRSIAVVGASSHQEKTGNFVLRSALASRVEKVYPVHAGGTKEILGQKAYLSIEDIPDNKVDLFLFAVPQQHILPGFRSAVAKGCRAAVIFTAGFREAGPEGARQQAILQETANEAGVKIIGPNTMGFFRSDSFVNATFMPVLSEIFTSAGDVTVISQSGGVAGLIINQFIEQALPVGTVVCLGNRANVEFADLLDYCVDDAHTSLVALFIEGLDDLRRFYQAAGRCALKKPVLVLSAGHTTAGQRIARSHTGSMATSQALYQGAFRQAGLLQVSTVQELVDTVKIIKMCPLPHGNRVAITTHTAGPAILASDVLERGGLRLAELSEATKKALVADKILPSFIPAGNPVDLATFGYMERQRYIDSLKLLVEDENIDCTLTVCVSSLGDKNTAPFPIKEFKKVIERSPKPAAFIWAAPVSYKEEFKEWTKAGISAYPTPERAATALVNLMRYAQIKRKTEVQVGFKDFPEELEKLIQRLLVAKQEFIFEPEAKQILELAGVQVARAAFAADEEEAVRLAEQTGYPVVLKVVAGKVEHKSDVGGVMLNLKNENEVRLAFQQVIQSTQEKMPDADLRGVSVQPMLPAGHEIIVGGLRAAQAGPVVMFGLGGIWVEVLKDVTFRLAPVAPAEAREMIEEIKGYPVLQGIRGKNAVNIEVLVDLIVKVSCLLDQFPIREIDLNPVIFSDSQYAVADARIILLAQ